MTASPHYALVPKDIDANLRFRKAMLLEAGSDPLAAAQIWTMCSEDLLFYVNTFCWTFDPRPGKLVIPFVTYPEFQDEAMLTIADCVKVGRDAVIYKSRDMGASWMGLTVLEWLWHFRDYMKFLLVSRNQDLVDLRGNSKTLFWKIDFLHKHQPMWLLPTGRELGDKDPNRKLLHLKNADNNSVLDGESTTGDAGRGDRRAAMLVDEHAAFKINEGYNVLNSTRDMTPCRLFNSTPKGANTAFYDVVHKMPAVKKIRLHWSSHPEKNQGLYTTDEETGKVLLIDNWAGPVEVTRPGEEDPEWVQFPDGYPFRLDKDDPRLRSPWYDYQCDRCVSDQEVAAELDIDFHGSAYPFFKPRDIKVLTEQYCRPPTLVGDLEYDPVTLRPKRFVEHPKGKLQLWIELGAGRKPPTELRYVSGSDVSAGTGASNSVTCLANRDTGEKVARWACPNTDAKDAADMAMALGYFFNKAFLVWDGTGAFGVIFGKRVIAKAYGDVYYRRDETRTNHKVTDKPGYFLTDKTRTVLLQDYRAALSEHRYINRSEQGMKECYQFIHLPDGAVVHSESANTQNPTGARSAHGDEVIADALCCVGLDERQIEEKAKPPKIPPGSLAWRRREKAIAMSHGQKDGLGEGW